MYYSQCGQDKFLVENVFKQYKNGFFVDVGAHDGKDLNNTLFFENQLGWNGINVEPIPSVYNRLLVNRPSCINYNCAIDSVDGNSEFILNTGYTEMLSGLKNHYDPRHNSRLNSELQSMGGTSTVIHVKTKRLETIFDTHSVKNVHYLSIDVEGAEKSVIESINFDKVFIDVIEFENNYPDSSKDIISYLESKGYSIIEANNSWDVMMIHKDSEFYTNIV
jgi:FkbM family methyltransferase